MKIASLVALMCAGLLMTVCGKDSSDSDKGEPTIGEEADPLDLANMRSACETDAGERYPNFTNTQKTNLCDCFMEDFKGIPLSQAERMDSDENYALEVLEGIFDECKVSVDQLKPTPTKKETDSTKTFTTEEANEIVFDKLDTSGTKWTDAQLTELTNNCTDSVGNAMIASAIKAPQLPDNIQKRYYCACTFTEMSKKYTYAQLEAGKASTLQGKKDLESIALACIENSETLFDAETPKEAEPTEMLTTDEANEFVFSKLDTTGSKWTETQLTATTNACTAGEDPLLASAVTPPKMPSYLEKRLYCACSMVEMSKIFTWNEMENGDSLTFANQEKMKNIVVGCYEKHSSLFE